MHILKESTKNRINFTFPDAVHMIENLNISEHMISANIKSYASLESYEGQSEESEKDAMRELMPAIHNEAFAINEKHVSFERAKINEIEVIEAVSEPYEMMKYQVLVYLTRNESDFENGEIVL